MSEDDTALCDASALHTGAAVVLFYSSCVCLPACSINDLAVTLTFGLQGHRVLSKRIVKNSSQSIPVVASAWWLDSSWIHKMA